MAGSRGRVKGSFGRPCWKLGNSGNDTEENDFESGLGLSQSEVDVNGKGKSGIAWGGLHWPVELLEEIFKTQVEDKSYGNGDR